MIEVRFNTNTKVVTGWCADGHIDRGWEDEAIVELDIPIPPNSCTAYLYNGETLIDNPDYPIPQPPCSIHLARLTGINPDKVRPATVIRTWEDREYTYDCFVTQTIKGQWQEGDISVGDIVLVEFLEDTSDKAIVVHKVYKTW